MENKICVARQCRAENILKRYEKKQITSLEVLALISKFDCANEFFSLVKFLKKRTQDMNKKVTETLIMRRKLLTTHDYYITGKNSDGKRFKPFYTNTPYDYNILNGTIWKIVDGEKVIHERIKVKGAYGNK